MPELRIGDDVDDSNIVVTDNRAAQAEGLAVVGSGNDFSTATNIHDESITNVDSSDNSISNIDASLALGERANYAGGDIDASQDLSTTHIDSSDRSVSNVDASLNLGERANYAGGDLAIDRSVSNIDASDRSVSNIDASDRSVSNIDASVDLGGGQYAGGDLAIDRSVSNIDASDRSFAQKIQDSFNSLVENTNIDASDRRRTKTVTNVDRRSIDNSRTSITTTDFGAIAAGERAFVEASNLGLGALETNLRFGHASLLEAGRAYENSLDFGQQAANKAYQLATDSFQANQAIVGATVAELSEDAKTESLRLAEGQQKIILGAFAMIAVIFIFGAMK